MLNISKSCKIYLCTGSTDMRKGINGLSILAQAILSEKFCNGALFVFRGKRADRIKILWWDGQGFCLFYKCLDSGKFTWPNSEAYVNALINIAGEIRLGAGRSTIERLVKQELKGELGKEEQKEIITGKNDEIIATWKPNGIVFAKGLNVNRVKFNKMLAEFFAGNN